MKKTVLFLGMLATVVTGFTDAAQAYPDHGRDRGRDHGRGNWHRDEWPTPRHRHYAPTRIYSYYYAQPQTVYVAPTTSTRLVCRNYTNPAPTIIGGIAGGALGSTVGHGNGRTGAIVAGTLLGGLLGSQYSTSDRYCTREVFETAPIGNAVTWVSPQTDYSYTVVPQRDYSDNGRYCREYQASANIGGKLQETYGTACQEPDGSWQIIN